MSVGCCRLAMLSLISAYKIEKRLGTGPNSHVDLAISPLGATVAIKTIDITKLPEHLRECVHREHSVMAKLNHPHIIKLHQVIESDIELHMVRRLYNAPMHQKIYTVLIQ
jgi:serine/threonine protein kinase